MQSYFNQVTENLGEENFEKTLNTKKLQWFDHVTIVFGTVLILKQLPRRFQRCLIPFDTIVRCT